MEKIGINSGNGEDRNSNIGSIIRKEDEEMENEGS